MQGKGSVWFLLLAAVTMAGCTSRPREIVLCDGRRFEVSEAYNDGRHIFFSTNEWEYVLPVGMLASPDSESAPVITKITLTRNCAAMADVPFRALDDLFARVNAIASETNLVILHLPDAGSWSYGQRQAFGRRFGKLEGRPHVGLEACWATGPHASTNDG